MGTKHTFEQGVIALRSKGGFALIPDDVVNDQKGWDAWGKSFPAIPCTITGKPLGPSFRASLRGKEYGLYTTGSANPVIASV